MLYTFAFIAVELITQFSNWSPMLLFAFFYSLALPFLVSWMIAGKEEFLEYPWYTKFHLLPFFCETLILMSITYIVANLYEGNKGKVDVNMIGKRIENIGIAFF